MKVVATEPVDIVSPELTPVTMAMPNVVQTTSSSDYDELLNKPSINGVILQGEKEGADYGLYGANNPETFVYTQSTPSDRWEIVHNLNKYPSVTIVDSAGSIVVGECEYVDMNTLVCTFKGAFSGECYLN